MTQHHNMSSIKASVVIPTLNSAKTLESCLVSIKNNNTRYEYEIIVVDAGSSDETKEIASRYADKILDGVPSRVNRNKGIEIAKGNIICFTDSDCTVPPTWIEQLVNKLLELNKKDKKIIGVGGPNYPVSKTGSLISLAIARTIRSPLISFRARNVTMTKQAEETLHNPPINSAYFKKMLQEVGGFSEQYNVGEDLGLDASLGEKGYRLFYIPDISVYHQHRTNFNRFVRQMYSFGKARIRVGKRFKKFLRWYHFGPLILCIMTFSPLIFIPFLMALTNAGYVAIQERNIKLFFFILLFTMSFYVVYGAGEIVALVRGN
ncbi:MAG: glycosyltransferase [Dehalococcoidia bacterium]|nr:glycosyltransferase [Dehalococcoidia bacterium]